MTREILLKTLQTWVKLIMTNIKLIRKKIFIGQSHFQRNRLIISKYYKTLVRLEKMNTLVFNSYVYISDGKCDSQLGIGFILTENRPDLERG